MHRTTLMTAVTAALACLATTGCATNLKQRVAQLEIENRNLVDQLNRSRTDLTNCYTERDNLDERVISLMSETDDLRTQLAAMPVPEKVAPGWTPVPGGAMITINDKILFSAGKVELRNEAKRALDAVVSAVQGEYHDKEIIVFGHTDDAPIKKSGWADNWELSAQRSLAVVRYLQQHGVNAKRLIASGRGQYSPIAGGKDESARARNRRVEILATDMLNK